MVILVWCRVNTVPVKSNGRGALTKTGNHRIRYLLVRGSLVNAALQQPQTAKLQIWADGITRRRDKQIAVVALARKLTGILYAMWRDGTTFMEKRLVKYQDQSQTGLCLTV